MCTVKFVVETSSFVVECVVMQEHQSLNLGTVAVQD